MTARGKTKKPYTENFNDDREVAGIAGEVFEQTQKIQNSQLAALLEWNLCSQVRDQLDSGGLAGCALISGMQHRKCLSSKWNSRRKQELAWEVVYVFRFKKKIGNMMLNDRQTPADAWNIMFSTSYRLCQGAVDVYVRYIWVMNITAPSCCGLISTQWSLKKQKKRKIYLF